MVASTTTWKRPELFEIYIKKFRSVFDMHGVHFGSPGNLPDFMQKLAEDRHFAMDFWALTGTLGSKEGGQISDEQMLMIIVQGVAGREIRDSDGDLKEVVKDLTSLLAGVDIHSPAGGYSPSGQNDAGELPVSSTPNPSPATDAVRDEPASPDATSSEESHPFGEALSRIERNNLELKLHLDNIAKRMSRLEPHLEELTSRVSSTTEQVRKPVEEPLLRPQERPGERPQKNSRLVLEPGPLSKGAAGEEDDPSIPIPLEGYSQRGGRRSAIVFAVLVLLMVGGIFLQQRYGAALWQRYGPFLRERYGLLLQQVHGVGKVDESAANQKVVDNAAEGSAPATAPANDGSNVANPPAAPSTAVLPDSIAAPSASTAESGTPTGQAGGNAALSSPPSTRGTTSRRAASAQDAETTAADDAFGVDEAGAVKVSPAVMDANLMASRLPVYPDAAKLAQIEGSVVMQAIISKDGTVKYVRVIDGDRHLRSAALEAVRKWRYRPYLLNGRLVDVATTITVDFELDQ
jgi:TonB family protein